MGTWATLGSILAGSVALNAEAFDFLADAFAYGVTLWAAGKSLRWRATSALIKAALMAGFSGFLLWRVIHSILSGQLPTPETMGLFASVALAANVITSVMLYKYRTGDSNMRAVWLCSRNDALNDIAVLLAALGVYLTQQPWPDWLTGLLLVLLNVRSVGTVVRQARQELKQA